MATPFHSRADWGARAPKATPSPIASEGLTAHYGGDSPWGVGPDRSTGARFRDSTDHSRCASIVRAWQSFHMTPVSSGGRGWNDLAYNACVCPHGHRYDGRGPRKRSGANGTNTGNDRSEAVVYIAGGDDPLTDEAKLAYHDEAERFGRPLRWQHSNWKSTSCAGGAIKSWQWVGWPRPAGEGELTMADISAIMRRLDTIENAVVVDISLSDQVEPGVSTLLELAARTDRNVTDTVNELFHGEAVDRVEDMTDAGQRKVNLWGLLAGGKRLAETEDRVAAMDEKLDTILGLLAAMAQR